jgi:DnaJ-class molecular chaperone
MKQGRAYFSKKRKAPVDSATGPNLDPLGYYALLGLKGQEKTATPKDIAAAFRREAQKSHPDLVGDEEQDKAKEAMQNLVEAYTVLRDAVLRREYDLGLLSK